MHRQANISKHISACKQCPHTHGDHLVNGTHYTIDDVKYLMICWALPSNQSFYRQIPGYGVEVDGHWEVDNERGSWANKTATRH